MIVLGINEDHNATAALIKDGEVIACSSEERFSRVKNDSEYPFKAINSILESTGITPEQIDAIAFATETIDAIQLRTKRITRYSISDYVKEMHEHWRKVLYENKSSTFWEDLLNDGRFNKPNENYYDYSYMDKMPQELWQQLASEERKNTVHRHLSISKEKIKAIDHHTSHAYYAYFASPYSVSQKATIITADGWGDGCNATISIVEKGKIKEIHRTGMCHLARIYRWITLLLGMKPNEHEYKVMGLAAYAQDYVRDPAYAILKETLVVDGIDFRWKNKPTDMYFYFQEKFEGLRFDGIAAGLQLWLEDMLSDWVTNVMKHTKTDILYFSGGLAMNVKANKVIAELPVIKKLYVSPSGGDESLAIGAAYVAAKNAGDTPRTLQNAYLGYAPTVEEANVSARPFRSDSAFNVIDNPDNEFIADLLANGKVLGRCVGKMEFGARALGNRSILCNPSNFDNLRIINEKIKFRDFWMPFTPSILFERGNDYLVNPKQLDAYYMALAFDSTSMAKNHIKAAMHPYDFSIRAQLVKQEMNPEYYALIKAFEQKTGIGALLNTSLNLHGSPIVCNAEDAIETLVKSGLDGMLLPGILIIKKESILK